MMNFPTILIIAVLAALVVLAVRYIARNGAACAEGCSGVCSTCGSGCPTGKKTASARNEYYQAVDQFFREKERR